MKLVIGLLLMLLPIFSYADWPSLPFPDGAKVEGVGEDVRLNGVPMRMYRVLSDEGVANILSFYRDALGPDHAEASVHQVSILSQMQGEYFISVRVKQAGPNVTETLLAISHADGRQQTGLPLGFTLPAGSELLSDMESTDNGKHARQLIFTNHLSMDANSDFMQAMLKEKGYRLQPTYTKDQTERLSMMFDGKEREAIVVLTRIGQKTNIVMTTILNK
jgi:hypothetical protein